MRRSSLLALALLLGVAATACGSAATQTASSGTAIDSHAQAASDTPSPTARMICAHEAQSELAGVLATKPTRITTPTWTDHVYSCNYLYPQGTITLSVKELTDTATTTAYFDHLGATLGRLPDNIHLGQGAFQTPNGSMIVRKDFKVLLVDVSHLPNGFDQPGYTAPDVASATAITILGCWN
jgi:hypothetical protein